MQIRKILIQKINPAPYNPRKDLKPGDLEYQKLLKSLDEFDCVEPLVWNKRTGNLVGGHQRFKILQARGDREVLCSVVDLPFEKEKALNIALNKISGEWDSRKLGELLDELIREPDFDFEVTGFDIPEATRIIDDVLAPDDFDQENFDLASELRSADKPITRRGEVIELGQHRILCGDSTRSSNISKLFGREKPSLMLTDPPYGIDYVAIKDKARVLNDTSKRLARMLRVIASTDCKTKYICGHWKTFVDYVKVLGPPATLIVWNESQQSNSSMKGHNFHLYNPRHEFIFYHGSQRHKRGLYEENVWNIPNEISTDHPTVKPVSLCIRAIRNSSSKNDIVFDPFLGSGSTLIAAERLGRRCVGIELEPRYCDVVVRRFIAAAGKDSVTKKIAERYRRKEVAV
jgi:DNA modification methylase